MYSDGIAGENCLPGLSGPGQGRRCRQQDQDLQFTFPLATLDQAYAASGYGASVRKLAQLSRASEMVFADGTALQMAGATGNAAQGYVVPPGSRRFPLNRRRGTAVEAASH